MNFVNHTGWTVNVYWLDYSGTPVFYKSLGGWQSFYQDTYVTHPWLLVRSDGYCLASSTQQLADHGRHLVAARRQQALRQSGPES